MGYELGWIVEYPMGKVCCIRDFFHYLAKTYGGDKRFYTLVLAHADHTEEAVLIRQPMNLVYSLLHCSQALHGWKLLL
jgi:hypothetical protein